MKVSKKLQLVLIILICILVILFGFIGAFKKVGNAYKNILPDYKFASDIKGSTIMEFDVDKSTNTTYYDEDGNEIDSSSVENKEDYTTKETPVNAEEVLTDKNYNQVVKIMKKRLNFLNVDQYQIDLDNKTGKIVLTIEDDYIEDVESLLPLEAKLQIIDSKTEDAILDYTDFKSVNPTYASLDEGYITYLNIKLNKSGLEKINDIDKYKNAEITVEEKTEEDSSEDTTAEENKLKVMFDEDEICEVSYDDIVVTGKTLRITTKSNITSNSTIQSELNINTVVSKLATFGKLPVVYKLSAEEFVKPDILNYNNLIIIVLAILAGLIIAFFIIKYKSKGLLASLGFATVIALFLLLVRVTKISISLNGISAAIATLLLNFVLINNILNNSKNMDKVFSENMRDAYLKSMNIIIINLIVLVVFAFSNMTVINSLGLILFWGWLSTLLGNLIFTIPMLSITERKV